jgi:hypothetical protein
MDWATDGYEQLLMMDDCTSLLHKNNNMPAHQPNQSNSRNVVASGLWDSHGPCLVLASSSMNYNYNAITQQQAYSIQIFSLTHPPSFDVILEDAPVKPRETNHAHTRKREIKVPTLFPSPSYWRGGPALPCPVLLLMDGLSKTQQPLRMPSSSISSRVPVL